MTKQFVLPSKGPTVDRQQPLLENADYSSRGGARHVRLAEVAGGTTAECAAVCCCCPCSLVNLVVLAVYKLPAGACRKALRRKRRRRITKNVATPPPPPLKCNSDEKDPEMHLVTSPISVVNGNLVSGAENKEVVELDKEMFEKFYGGGFWRSSSGKSET